MDLSISKKEIFREVEKRTSMEGFVLPENYDVVWANDSRGVLLDSFWADGCSEVIQLMKRYISNDTIEHSFTQYDSDEVLTINADMPARYNALMDGNVATDAKMIVACKILVGWLKVNMPEAAAKYESEYSFYYGDMKEKMLYRVSPESDSSEARADEVHICTHDLGMDYPREDNERLVQIHSCVY